MGQSRELLAARRMETPSRKGSVLEAFMCIVAMSSAMERSSYSKVEVGSYFVLCEEVYSETLMKPKKAVVIAAQSINLSWCSLEELNKSCIIVNSRSGVMGRL